ncbi:lanthionine synthetase LanC family protein [Chitinophaga sp. Hz27]|uniref:lanthionine synthetase LanC family protein n=1 Tax=Chitinophaga sp. Hz27 TaxID=3347169 RepID=UPI0035DB913D
MKRKAQEQLEEIHKRIIAVESINDSFLKGKLSLIFYLYHQFQLTHTTNTKTHALQLLKEVVEGLEGAHPRLYGASFAHGGAGMAYTLNYLQERKFISFQVKRELAILDKYLLDMAVTQIEEGGIDFLQGGLGILHYFSQRTPEDTVTNYQDILVEKLYQQAEKQHEGWWWTNSYSYIKTNERQYIDFGLSHGQSGILLVLLNLLGRSSKNCMIEEMVTQGIRFIKKHKIDIDAINEDYSFFPLIIKRNTNEFSAPNRLAWCYGDLNQVLVFSRAGKLLHDKPLTELAYLIGLHTLMRKDINSTLIKDAGFCHGSAGVAQSYKNLFEATGNLHFQEGYHYWIGQTIEMLDRDLGAGHYEGKEHDLLEGLVGVAFTLMSFVSAQRLDWSAALLL